MKPKLIKGNTALIDSLTVVGGLLFLFDLFNGSTVPFFLSCFMLVLGIFPRVYLGYVSRHFEFHNTREKRFVMEGDQIDLILSFGNKGFLPISGEVMIRCDAVLHLEGEKFADKGYIVAISVRGQSTLEMTLPFNATQRGVGRINQLMVHLSDPLKLFKFQLDYDFIRKEVVIFPKKQAVAGENTFSLLKEGTKTNPFSLFQDLSLPIGTRDYRPGDSLKAIHWKATARKSALQTKLVEKTIGITWSFVVLIGSNMGKEAVSKLEDQLQTLARLAEIAYKKGIMFDIYINTKPMGRALITQTLEGNDRVHYLKIMERLARIQVNFLRIDPKLAIREMNKAFRSPRILYLAGAIDEIRDEHLLKQWAKNGHRLISIGEAGLLHPIGKGGERVAT